VHDSRVGGDTIAGHGEKIETDEAYESFRTAYYKEAWFKIYDTFYKDLATNAFIVSAAANVQTFGTIAVDEVDVDATLLEEPQRGARRLRVGGAEHLDEGHRAKATQTRRPGAVATIRAQEVARR
jgi:hypothetical protein